MKYKSVGITGTRKGMSDYQKQWFERFLDKNEINVLQHGDCIGVDEQAATMASERGIYIIAHIGNSAPIYKAQCIVNDLLIPRSENLMRNRRIVRFSELMLAFPSTNYNIPRSGTWYTIQYAIDKSVPVIITTPDGSDVV